MQKYKKFNITGTDLRLTLNRFPSKTDYYIHFTHNNKPIRRKYDLLNKKYGK